MATGVKPRVKIPKTAPRGGVITIKTLISHIMESGHRPGPEGGTLPRSIIHRLTCAFDGQTVIDVDLGPGISTNPYFQFDAVVPHSGTFTFTWYDDDGAIYETARAIDVT